MSPVARRAWHVAGSIVISAVILFGAAGRLAWTWAWIYVGLSVGNALVSAAVLLPRHRDLIVERETAIAYARAWDRLLAGTATVLAARLGLLVAGLDVRLSWTSAFPLGARVAGLAGFGAGSALFLWAMASNPFFSSVVRIQKERGHRVVDTGPYRAVRHPGYLGWILAELAVPPILGSTWALVPAALGCALWIVRTALEDLTLRRELEGYQAYTERVRFRLLPGIW
jgi:protein-S-isoprenylcysteine O-methyltransferase Ste14